jgi:hypothetical protein
VIRGAVRYALTEEGIPDVAVTLCQGPDTPATVTISALPPRESIGEIRITTNISLTGSVQPVVEARDRLGNLVTDPQPVVCKNPVTSTTDRSGRFDFRDVSPGEYTVRAQRDGYFGPQRAGRWQLRSATTVIVLADQAVPEISLSLIAGGTITGRVRDMNGQPLAEATVQALEMSGFGVNASLRVAFGRQADDRGEYRLYGLAPGEYYIAVTRIEGGVQQRTFYPATMDPSEATAVAVSGGEEKARIDIDLKPAIVARASGTVMSSSGSLSSVNLTVQSRGLLQDNIQRVRLGSVQSPGAFILGNFAPGVYDFVATGVCPGATATVSPPPAAGANLPSNERELLTYLEGLAARGISDPARDCIGIATVEFRNRDVDGIAITLAPRVDLVGGVSINGNSFRPGDIQISVDADVPTSRRPFRKIPTNPSADGTFSIPGVHPGRFRPDVRLSGQLQDAYVADVRQGGVSVLSGFDVGTVPPIPLEVVVNTGGGSVSGTVRDSGQRAVSSAFVVLVPPVPRNQNRSLYPIAIADAAGRFTVRGVAPGEYRMFAWYQDPGQLIFNPTALSRYETFGRALNVGPGPSVGSLQVNVVPDLFLK